nr:MAG: replication associated protein [Arizlama virus]
MPNVRHWCATFFSEPKRINDTNLRYMIVGEEICPNTKKVHWQCYLEFKTPVSMKQIKTIFDDKTIHLEKRNGTKEQARDYCKKDGKFTEYGIWCTGQGFRTDLKSLTAEMASGKRINEIMVENPEVYCKYRNGLKDIQASLDKKNSNEFREVEVEVISGPTGCGKTRKAMENATFKIEGSEMNWWDGYDADESIVIDEYDNDVICTRLLNLLDGYQLRLPVKGGFTYARWKKVYITTNLRKHELHAKAKKAHIDALFRRITRWTDLWPDDGERGTAGNTRLQYLPDD